MNKRVQNFKKSLVNAFKKIREYKSSEETFEKSQRFIYTQMTTTSTMMTTTTTTTTTATENSTTSSGLSSSASTSGISSIDTNETIDTSELQSDIIQLIIKHQNEYLNLLKYGLENYVRPLSALIDPKLYFATFQNIEKIYSTSLYLRDSIVKSHESTNDMYVATIQVIKDNLRVINAIYDTYLNGYLSSYAHLKHTQIQELTQLFNSKLNCKFDVATFIYLPLTNINQLFKSFNSLYELDTMTNSCAATNASLACICENFKELNCERRRLCKSIKRIKLKRNKRSTRNRSYLISSCESLDYIDSSNGLKYYFV